MSWWWRIGCVLSLALTVARVHAGEPSITFGGEYRFKTEFLDEPDFGIRAADEPFTAVGQRGLVHADAHVSEVARAYVELGAATDAGRKPTERPFDRSRPDITQAFVDLSLFGSTTLRVGRQQLDSGGNRLISTREAANLRLAFDMVHAETLVGRARVVAFYGRPVLNARGAFDDHHNPAEKLLGGWLSWPLTADPEAAVANVFFVDRNRDRAIYAEGAASDHRRTVGARFSQTRPAWDYFVQGAGQYGSFGSDDIRAFGFAGDVGWHPHVRLSPRLGVSFGYASADRHRDDELGSFDVLYPNLGYFTDAPVYYPGNTADLQPNVTLSLPRSVRVRAGSDVVIRVSKRDSVYGPPGLPLIQGNGTGSSFVAALSYARADWQWTSHVQLTMSLVHGSIGSLVRRAGGSDFSYAALAASLKF